MPKGKRMPKSKKYKVESGEVKTMMVSFDDMGEQKEVSITEWINGEGFDLDIDSKVVIPLSYEEASAVRFALSQLDEF